jgi:chromate transporter
MSASPLSDMAWTFATLSLVAIGGANAVIPEMRHEVVDVFRWMDTPTFLNLFAIAQAAPGPNVLVVSLVGWQVAGLPGLLVATLAISLPSSVLAFATGRALRRLAETRPVLLLRAGLVPIAVGLILASGVVLARAADHSLLGLAITLGAAAILVGTNLNPLVALAAGTLASVVASFLGVAP